MLLRIYDQAVPNPSPGLEIKIAVGNNKPLFQPHIICKKNIRFSLIFDFGIFSQRFTL